MESGGHQPCTRCSTASGLGDTGHPRRTLSHYQVRKFPLSSTGNGVSVAGSKQRQSVVVSHLREDVALLEARTRGTSVRREPCPSGLVGCRGGLWSCRAARQATSAPHQTRHFHFLLDSFLHHLTFAASRWCCGAQTKNRRLLIPQRKESGVELLVFCARVLRGPHASDALDFGELSALSPNTTSPSFFCGTCPFGPSRNAFYGGDPVHLL